MWAESSRSCRLTAAGRRTELSVRVMPAVSCCRTAVGGSGVVGATLRSGCLSLRMGHAQLLLQERSPQSPDRKKKRTVLRDSGTGTFCLLLSCFSFITAPSDRRLRHHPTDCCRRADSTLVDTGGGWVISTGTRRGLIADHAHSCALMRSGLFTVGSHGGAEVTSHTEGKIIPKSDMRGV